MENKLKEVERKKKEKKKRNIVIRRVEMKERGKIETMKQIIRAMGAKIETKKIRKIGREKEKRRRWCE